MSLASVGVFGCAGSNQNTGSGTTGSMSRSENVTAGGKTQEGKQLDVLVVEEQLMVPVATLSVTALTMENPIKVKHMFKDIKDTEQYDVLALAKTSPNLSTFVKLIEQANLADDLQRVENATLFAPTNEAFAKMPKDKLMSMLAPENTAMLSRTLQAHIIASDVSSSQLRSNTRIRISENEFIPIESTGNVRNIRVGGAQVLKSDIEASNGRIHVVDSVIMPGEDFRQDNR